MMDIETLSSSAADRDLEALHTFVIEGGSECHQFEAAPTCSGGKVFRNCQHQVCNTIVINSLLHIYS